MWMLQIYYSYWYLIKACICGCCSLVHLENNLLMRSMHPICVRKPTNHSLCSGQIQFNTLSIKMERPVLVEKDSGSCMDMANQLKHPFLMQAFKKRTYI